MIWYGNERFMLDLMIWYGNERFGMEIRELDICMEMRDFVMTLQSLL